MSSVTRVLSAFINPELKAAFHAFTQSQILTESKLLAVIVADFLVYAMMPHTPEPIRTKIRRNISTST